MIYDLIAPPDYQRRGIDSWSLERLASRCTSMGILDIQPFCARAKRAFHEKRGFPALPDDASRMQRRREV